MQSEEKFDIDFNKTGFEKKSEPVVSSRKKNASKKQESGLASDEKKVAVKTGTKTTSQRKSQAKPQSKSQKSVSVAEKTKSSKKDEQKLQTEDLDVKEKIGKKVTTKPAGVKRSTSTTKNGSKSGGQKSSKNEEKLPETFEETFGKDSLLESENSSSKKTTSTKTTGEKKTASTTKTAGEKKSSSGTSKTKSSTKTTNAKKSSTTKTTGVKRSSSTKTAGAKKSTSATKTTKSGSKSSVSQSGKKSPSVDTSVTSVLDDEKNKNVESDKEEIKNAQDFVEKTQSESEVVDFELCVERFLRLKSQFDSTFGKEENHFEETKNEIEETNSGVQVVDEKTELIKDEKSGQVLEMKSRNTIFRYFLGAMIIFGICFISSLFTFNIILTPIEVQGFSMFPTINASAYSYYDKDENCNIWKKTDIVYISKSKNFSNGDIVVINAGKTPSGNQIIKRIVASPGDTLTFKVTEVFFEHMQQYFNVDIYLNGEKLEEDYTKDKQTTILYRIFTESTETKYYSFNNTFVSALNDDKEFTISLGDDEYFVMGDNRSDSTDSRVFGTVKKSEVAGKVVLLVENGDDLFQAIWKAIFAVRLQFA